MDDPQAVEFKEGLRAVFLGHDNYGCVGTIVPDRNKTIGKGASKVPAASRRYCLRVQPLAPGAENAARVAKRIMQQYQVGAAAACTLLWHVVGVLLVEQLSLSRSACLCFRRRRLCRGSYCRKRHVAVTATVARLLAPST
jgi:hypothetical protein